MQIYWQLLTRCRLDLQLQQTLDLFPTHGKGREGVLLKSRPSVCTCLCSSIRNAYTYTNSLYGAGTTMGAYVYAGLRICAYMCPCKRGYSPWTEGAEFGL